MNPPEDHRTQYLALFLIVAAAICIFIGNKWEYRDLVNFAQVFGGAGVGILTGQKIQSALSNNAGGRITVNSVEAAPIGETK